MKLKKRETKRKQKNEKAIIGHVPCIGLEDIGVLPGLNCCMVHHDGAYWQCVHTKNNCMIQNTG